MFTNSFVILIKPNVSAHYDYFNILLPNICVFIIFNNLMCKILTICHMRCLITFYILYWCWFSFQIVEIRQIFKLEHVNILT